MGKLNELDIVRRIEKKFAGPAKGLVTGIGDDCAVIAPTLGCEVVVTTDTLVEGVHFRCDLSPARLIGEKSAAVNLSDVAAMGAKPKFCFLSLTLTNKIDGRWVASYLAGFEKTVKKHGVALAGGNVAMAGRDLSFTVTLMGEVKPKLKVLRSGAKPGDHVFVTGTPGDAILGLNLSLKKKKQYSTNERKLIKRHQAPTPRVEWGMALAKSGAVSAMIDISDGVALDLTRMMDASKTSAEIDLMRFPLSQAAFGILETGKTKTWETILTGGEDYELLFTVREEKFKKVMELIKQGKIDASPIGLVTKRKRKPVLILDPEEREVNLSRLGFIHRI
ncbi:Thiamine-monophosphate kinase [hydrothermal vent metagenome]|uniref:Thiamine-monophosphate kinase n=1 Tax=hydrothermal vent metagenome TaxID=652676 RepID=A0A3B1C0I1_9ZZZZ